MLGLSEIAALAIACAPAIEVGTVQAIVNRESRGNPNAIGTTQARLSHQPRTREHALYVAGVLERAGVDFDVGIAQLNIRNLRRFGVSVTDALEPCKNMQLMQAVLVEAHERAQRRGLTGVDASLAAVSVYNTGHFKRGFNNGYVADVVRAHPGNSPP